MTWMHSVRGAMEHQETHGLGYEGVDDDPNVAVLLSTMDATAGWEAVRQLRAWERRHLALGPGQRLLDVGCGLGDAALSLAVDLGATGKSLASTGPPRWLPLLRRGLNRHAAMFASL